MQNYRNISYVVIQSDNRILCTGGQCMSNFNVASKSPSGDRCIQLTDDEALYIAYLLQRARHVSYYFDPITRVVTNDKGEPNV